MKIGDKVKLYIPRFGEWKFIGIGTYIGIEKIYEANISGMMWLYHRKKYAFKKGFISSFHARAEKI